MSDLFTGVYSLPLITVVQGQDKGLLFRPYLISVLNRRDLGVHYLTDGHKFSFCVSTQEKKDCRVKGLNYNT